MGLVAIPRLSFARAPALAGAAALAGLVACGALICLHAAAGASIGLIPAAWHGEPGWLSGPLPGLGGSLNGHTYVPLFLAMCGCYAVVLATARHLDARMAIGAIVLLHAVFLLAPPLLSADVFGYIDYARIGALHGLDPYAHGPASVPHDAVFSFMRWRGNLPSPYGPLFTLGSYALAPLSVAASLWAIKALVAAASLAIVAIVWDCARRLRIEPLPAAVLVGLNPLVLVWAVGGAHNDLIVVAAGMAALWLAVRGRHRLAGAGFVAAVGLKLSAGVALPFLLARRRGALGGALAAGAALIALSFAVFGSGVTGMLRAQADQQNIVATASLPNQAGRLLGLGGATPGLRSVALVLFAVAFLALLVRTWRGSLDWVTATGWATLALLVSSAWLMPWYATWLLPLAALGRDRRLTGATLALCAYLVVMRTPI
ncbi:MAG: alpha,6-mannosyltransferase [Thermoleophilaceae bacterium]|jgi:alpha-1,6-mannosyltransferase|nr:alpha,6-mannosyltransferase [Thermoleophilaceae bacterium]